MRADAAASADEAVHLFETRGDPYRVVLLDDGIAGVATGTPTVLLTSVGPAGTRPRADAYVSKPVRQSQLRKALRQALAVGPPEPATSGAPARVNAAVPTSLRALLAEDNVVNQKVTVRMLEKLGIRADVAANGLEAVEMSQTVPYDLIFLDCQMPEMDGYQAAREIRLREGKTGRAPIIAMTADVLSRARCFESGMNGFIAKPVRLEDLAAAVRRHAPAELSAASQ
jgi:CheY-like chemotaxis protein